MSKPKKFYLLCALYGVVGASYAQTSVKNPDKFTEALVYAGYAEDAFLCKDYDGMTDPLAAAKKWTLEALSTVAQFTSDDVARTTRAKGFIDQQKAQLDVIVKWTNTIRDLPKSIDGALRRGRLISAELIVNDDGAPACHPIVKRLRGEVAEQRKRFNALVSEGDSLDGPAALEKYKAALKLNREDVELGHKIHRTSRNR